MLDFYKTHEEVTDYNMNELNLGIFRTYDDLNNTLVNKQLRNTKYLKFGLK